MTCATCFKPEPLCVCDTVAPVETRHRVLILQHPQEQEEVLGTARLATLQLPQSRLRIGLSWPNLGLALAMKAGETGGEWPADPRSWGVLYLGSAKGATAENRETASPLRLLDRKGEPEPAAAQAALGNTLAGIIVLDGTWSQAKTLWWRNPWLLKCRRLVLTPRFRSGYGRLRREPRPESLATLEAIALTLAELAGDEALFPRITAPFQALLSRVRAAGSTAGSPPGIAPGTFPVQAGRPVAGNPSSRRSSFRPRRA